MCFIRSPFLDSTVEDVNLFRVSKRSEEQSARSRANTCRGERLRCKWDHLVGKVAFAACHPGQTPTEAQLQPLIHPVSLNPRNTASLKRLIFESQTLVCNEVKVKANRKDDAAATFAGAERDARIEQQKARLTGLRFKGEEECCHSSYDITLNMLEKKCLLYLGPEKFPTRRHELLQKKPSKEISIDQSQLVVKDKEADLTCPTVTELEVSNALKRRALAFDLVGLCTYDVMAAYRADLLDHLHTLPPPGYSAVAVQQVLRADRAAFMYLSERMTSLKRDAQNQLPLDLQLPAVLSQPNVAFHLLPLSGGTPKASSAPKASNPKKRSRSPRRQLPVKGQGGPKGRSRKSLGPNIPAGLINKVLETPQKQRLCWAYNFPKWMQQSQSRRKLSKGHSFVCRTGVFQTPLTSRPSLK